MDWQTYKLLCERPDYWSQWMLEQCEELLTQMHEHQLLETLQRARAAAPLTLPAGHQGSAATRMFKLSVQPDVRQRILAVVGCAVARGLTTEATKKRGLSGFAEAWQEYVDFPPQCSASQNDV